MALLHLDVVNGILDVMASCNEDLNGPSTVADETFYQLLISYHYRPPFQIDP